MLGLRRLRVLLEITGLVAPRAQTGAPRARQPDAQSPRRVTMPNASGAANREGQKS